VVTIVIAGRAHGRFETGFTPEAISTKLGDEIDRLRAVFLFAPLAQYLPRPGLVPRRCATMGILELPGLAETITGNQ
jgi:hypothetical protein